MKRTAMSLFVLLLFTGSVSAQTFTTLKSFGILTNVTGFNPRSQLVQGADGTLYGTAENGEGSVRGTVFKMQPDGSGFTVLKWFTNSLEGANPRAGLTLSGSTLYGTTYSGGSSNSGTVFKLNTNGTDYSVLKHFTGSDGANPHAGLALSNGVLYGTTYVSSSGGGTVFKVNIDGTGFTVLKYFGGAPSDGGIPEAGLTLSDGVLYGTTYYGGSSDNGTVFKLNTDGTGYTVLKHFTWADGVNPLAGLTLSGSVLYGTTYQGGSSTVGTVFKVNTDGTDFAVLKHFDYSNDGAWPYSGLTLSGGVLYGTTYQGGSSDWGTVFKVNTDGTGFTVIKHFTDSDGQMPYAGLTLSSNVLYGTTVIGGSWGLGTVFRMNMDGTDHMVLKSFSSGDGRNPNAGLTISTNVLYGTTYTGGAAEWGTVFKVNSDGTGYAVLKNFTETDGGDPRASLALSGSVLYGTTYQGGSSGSSYGAVFKLNTDGTDFTVLKRFTGGDGANPSGGLTLSDGVLYGTTYSGGSSNRGTVFKVNTDGTGYEVLKHFTGDDGAEPSRGLTLSGSVLYGTTYEKVFKLNTDGTGYTVIKHLPNASGLVLSGSVLYGSSSSGYGTVFKLNADGTGYAVLKHFSAPTLDPSTGTYTNSDGAAPSGELALSGSVLYGTTEQGGNSGYGTIFQMKADGTGYTVLKHFTGSDGRNPGAGLTMSGSTLYGTTKFGGSFDTGTVFKLDLSIPLSIQSLGDSVVLNWSNPAFALQAAPDVTGVYTNVPGATSPYTNAIVGPQQFFRLIGN